MRHLRSILILPGMGVIVIPALILLLTGSLNIGWSLPPPFNLLPILLGWGRAKIIPKRWGISRQSAIMETVKGDTI